MAFTSGCGFEGWHGSTAYTTEERAEIQAAQDFVCEHTGGRSCVPIEWDLDPNERSFGIIRETPVQDDAIATGGGKMFLPPVYNLRRVAGHEFGHWRGLGHLQPDEHGLMFGAEDGETGLVWTDADERECLRVHCRD